MTTNTGVGPGTTIEQAKELLRPQILKGFICPCCDQPAKMYKRILTSSMAYALIRLFNSTKLSDGIYIHIEDELKRLDVPSSIRGDVPKLRFFGLLEPMPGNKEDGNPLNGHYKLTPLGRSFIHRQIMVNKYVWLYNNRAFQVNDDIPMKIDIVQALKNKFNYEKLMDGYE